MAYEDNTTVTPEGQEVLNSLFDLIYDQDKAQPLDDPKRFKNSPAQMRAVVDRFKKNCPKIVTTMRRFMRGNTHVAYNQTGDSGIFVCDPLQEGKGGPGCGRRDFLWWWEFLDFGIYTNPKDWDGSVGLSPFPMTSYAKEQGVLVVARIKCNKVKTCDATKKGCGTTWRGSGNCPNPSCNNKKVVTVGCGKEHFAHFWVDIDMSWGSYWTDSKDAVEHNGVNFQGQPELPPGVIATIAPSSGFRNQDYGATPFFYRMFWQGLPPNNTYMDAADEITGHLPYIQIGYSGSGTRRPNGYECNSCGEVRYAPPNDGKTWNVPYEIHTGISNNTGATATDQTGGLCTNIGDKAGVYAGVHGDFGCNCGGTFEPDMKLPPVKMNATGPMAQKINALNQRLNQGRQRARILNALPTSIPLSKCRYAFTHQPLSVCTDPDHKGNSFYLGGDWMSANYQPLISGGGGRYSQSYKCYTCRRMMSNPRWRNGKYTCSHCSSTNIKQQSTNEVLDFCPTCGPTGDSSYIIPQPNGFIAAPKPYTITSSQPLTPQNAMDFSTGEMNQYMGKVLWNISLVDVEDDKEKNNLRIELPQIFIGGPIPDKLDLAAFQNPGGSASRHCPNEEAGPLTGEINAATQAAQAAAKAQQAAATTNVAVTLDDISTLGLPTICSGITNTGYTFLLCEGKSASAYIPKSGGEWQDNSPECRYGDGTTRPRFTEVPADNGTKFYPSRPSILSKECKVGTNYSWCDINKVSTQIVQDFLGQQNKALNSIVKAAAGSPKISGTHAMTVVEQMKIPQTGVTQNRIKCWTCEKIGGNWIPSRIQRSSQIFSRRIKDQPILSRLCGHSLLSRRWETSRLIAI